MLAFRCLVLDSKLLEPFNKARKQMLVHFPVSLDETIETLFVYSAANGDWIRDAVEVFLGYGPD